MARTNKIIDASSNEIESAKISAITLMQDAIPVNAEELFYVNDLEYIETGIKKLNDYSNKSWLLSSILLFSLIYDKGLYLQSGLTWEEYSKNARERLGLEPRDITEQLSAARFFIKNREELERQGFNPVGNNRKLSRAELATELCGNVHETIRHLVNDTWASYNEWYSSFKAKKVLPTEYKRDDIDIQGAKVYIKGIEAVNISDKIPEQDKVRLEKYITQIFEVLRQGNEPAIVSVYDEKEASMLPKLRDKYRQGK